MTGNLQLCYDLSLRNLPPTLLGPITGKLDWLETTGLNLGWGGLAGLSYLFTEVENKNLSNWILC